MATRCTDEVVLKDAVVILSGVKWFPLGIQLDIKKSELDRIKTENPQNENNCMIEVLHYWLKNTLSGCTWDKLANAVERMGGESKVVESLRARQELNDFDLAPPSKKQKLNESTVGEEVKSQQTLNSDPAQHTVSNVPILSIEEPVSDGVSSEGYASTPSSVSGIPSDDESASGYQVEPLKGCGCGKCTLYTLCQQPCPNPDGANLLRIWHGKVNELVLLQKEREEQCKQETCNILRLFATLIKNTRTCFTENEIPVREILEWLKDARLETIVKRFRHLPQVDEDKPHQVDQYLELFSILRDYWSWYNYNLLKDLIKAFGDNKLIKDLNNYKRHRKDYFKKRTQPTPYLAFGDDSKKESKVLLVKVDEEWDEIPLSRIHTLHYKIATILHVRMHTLYLASVSRGCIQMKFFFLHSDADQVIQLSSFKGEALGEHKIIEVKYGNDCVFQSCPTDSKPQLHHWTSSEPSSVAEEDYSENESEPTTRHRRRQLALQEQQATDSCEENRSDTTGTKGSGFAEQSPTSKGSLIQKSDAFLKVKNERAIEGLLRKTEQWQVSESDDKKPLEHVSESEKWEDVLKERIATNHRKIEQHVNISELSLYLDQEGLLDDKENEFLLSEASDREKVSRVLDSLKEKPNGFTKFLECVKCETNHVGHPYIASLLEGKQFASECELLLSSVCKGRIEKNLVRLKEGIDLFSLWPYLRQSFYLPYIQGNTQLLTEDDLEKVEGVETESKVMQLFLILDTKGPLAHSQFASCLRAEREHESHIELYEELFGDLNLLPSPISTENEGSVHSSGHSNRGKRKGRAEYPASDETQDKLVPFTPSKRTLLWLEMDGPLKGNAYLRLMRVCYRYHHSGQHDALEGEVQKIMSCNGYPPEFQALARVELAHSCTFQGKNERALELIEGTDGALSICEKIPGNNAAFIIGRCMHLLSGLYRYAKKHDRMKEYATKAMVALHGVAPGQESSIANYVNACAFLEYSYSTPSDVRIIEQHFRSAIDHAHQSEIAMYVILPQSHVRLAQLYLGSTQYHHGTTTNPENIKKARDSLNAVNFGFMSQRSKSLYYMVESDCYRAGGDIPAAIVCAKLARSTAEDIRFTLGVNSAESRLKSLLEIPTIVGGAWPEHDTAEGIEGVNSAGVRLESVLPPRVGEVRIKHNTTEGNDNYSSSKLLQRAMSTGDSGYSSCSDDESLIPFVPKDTKPLLEMDGLLSGNYDQLMTNFYHLHHNSDGHHQLVAEAEKAMAQDDLPLELQALYRIELARSFIFKTQNERAEELLSATLEICGKILGKNAFFIIGRCHHTLSDLYRFTNDYDRAKEHSGEALRTLDCVKPGLDTATAHYVNGCILLECLSQKHSVTFMDTQMINKSFFSAINDDRESDIARQVTIPQSHCRLAQLYISSATTIEDTNLKKARQSLDVCKRDFDFVSQISKHLYYVVESDWYRKMGDTNKAADSAREAYQIAEITNYVLGSSLMKTRLQL